MTKEQLDRLVDAIDSLHDLPLDPTNDYGNTLGDELHSIDYNLNRIADSLEQLIKIANIK